MCSCWEEQDCLKEHRVWYKYDSVKSPLSAFSPGNINIIIAMFFCHLYIGKEITVQAGSGREREIPPHQGKGTCKKESRGEVGPLIEHYLWRKKKHTEKQQWIHFETANPSFCIFGNHICLKQRQTVGTQLQVTSDNFLSIGVCHLWLWYMRAQIPD